MAKKHIMTIHFHDGDKLVLYACSVFESESGLLEIKNEDNETRAIIPSTNIKLITIEGKEE